MIASDLNDFQAFGPAHLGVLACGGLVAALLVLLARRFGAGRAGRAVDLAFAGALVVNKFCLLASAPGRGVFTLQQALPMHLCDWATITVVLALVFRWRLAYELSYFWGLAGTLQAVLTPDLPYNFPHPLFFTFFISHVGILVAIAYLTFGHGLRPTLRSLVMAILWSQVYVVAAFGVNLLTGANYGYLMAKPQSASLMDALAPWPWYLLQLEGLMVVFYLFYYSPFWLLDRWRLRRHGEGG